MRTSSLDTPVKFIKGVGPVRSTLFETLGVATVADLLEYLPFRYELLPKSTPIGYVQADQIATIVGSVNSIRVRGGYRKPSITAQVIDGTGACEIRWFNSPYLRDKLAPGQIIRATGNIEQRDNRAIMVNPTFRIISQDQDPLQEDVDVHRPVYAATSGLDSSRINSAVRAALARYADHIEETLPRDLRVKRNLPTRRSAICRIHHPAGIDQVPLARRRLAYEELLHLQLSLLLQRNRAARDRNAPPISVTSKIDRRIRDRFPFDLTAGQNNAVRQIVNDLNRNQPMTRLLQGDVGTGKTAVAMYAALATVANRYQVAILAPTEILAQQTFAKFTKYLVGSSVNIRLLVGGLNRSQRDRILEDTIEGDANILVGTHALIQHDVRFHNLGLVIVDEQHRFGVSQRQQLRAKGKSPHYLLMTATPIPRTLAMTIHGDLDISIINERPPGRSSVETTLVDSSEQGRVWEFVRRRLDSGEKVYVIYPLVEESENLDLKAATVEFDRLQQTELSSYKLGLMHGRMTAPEKDEVMHRFCCQDIQVLVSTTVVEVGVDVPQATTIVIEHAERYGLSQLHQLRGRIGRGHKQSYCLLLTESRDQKTRQRLSILCATNDGFKIADADLQMRGPGEITGNRQHGLPLFRAADLAQDLDLLQAARDDALAILHSDPELQSPVHTHLKAQLLRRYPSLSQ